MVRVAIAENLGIDERCVRVVAPDVGGGFGPKARLYPEEIILAALALTLDHPVRWVEDRSEHLLASAHSRDHHYRVTAYADRHGKVLGLDAEIVVDAGAYGMWPRGPTSETNMAARCLPGPYTIANYRVRGCTVATNKTPFGPYRGVGRTGACFAIERTIDEVARAVGRDPVELRTENMVRPEQMPYLSVGHMQYDGGDYPAAVRLCAQLLDMPAVRARRRQGELDRTFAGAAHIARVRLVYQRIVMAPMEPRACVAVYEPETDHYVLHVASQSAFAMRQHVARTMGVRAIALQQQ